MTLCCCLVQILDTVGLNKSLQGTEMSWQKTSAGFPTLWPLRAYVLRNVLWNEGNQVSASWEEKGTVSVAEGALI